MSSLPPHHRCDVLLVGAGPIGIEIGAALKAHGVDFLHIEAGNIASTIAWYAPGTPIFSSPDRLAIAGCPFMLYPETRARREDYLNYLRTVVQHHALDIRRYHRLTHAQRTPQGFRCTISHSSRGVGTPGPAQKDAGVALEATAQRVVLAVGNMHAPRLLGIPGEEAPNVSHYLGDIHDCAGCRVAIVGSRNSAAEAAVRLASVGASVSLCFRADDLDSKRVKPWILPDLRTLAREGKVRLYPRVRPVAIEPRHLVLAPLDADTPASRVEADRVLLLTGYVHSPTLFRMFALETQPDTGAPLFNPRTMETSTPGVFVAGTAAAGTETGGVTHFIENCHVHTPRILHGLGVLKAPPPDEPAAERPFEQRES
jgi:thioredoxin reductase (NADPH)